MPQNELDKCTDEFSNAYVSHFTTQTSLSCLLPTKYLRARAVPDTSIKTHHCFKPALLSAMSLSPCSDEYCKTHRRTCIHSTYCIKHFVQEVGDIKLTFSLPCWIVNYGSYDREVPCILLPLLSSVNSHRKLWKPNFQPSQQDCIAKSDKTLIPLLICHLLPLKQSKGLSKLRRICWYSYMGKSFW